MPIGIVNVTFVTDQNIMCVKQMSDDLSNKLPSMYFLETG